MSTDPTQQPPPRIVAKAARPRTKAGGPDHQRTQGAGSVSTPSSANPPPQMPSAPAVPDHTYGAPVAPGSNAYAPQSGAAAYQPPNAPAYPGGGIPDASPAQPQWGPGGPPAPEATEVLAASAAGDASGAVAASAQGASGGVDASTNPDEAALERARAERAARIEQAEAERQQRIAAQAERARRLGTVTPNAAVEQAAPVRTLVTRNTDKFSGSLGLLLLRLVTALVVGVHGFNQLVKIDETSQLIKSLALPTVLQNSSTVLAWIYAGGGVLAAVLLTFGFLTRFAGLLVALGSIASLAFVQWGNFRIFVGNGFLGEKELLLTAIGLLFFLLGAGGWALDAGFRRNRAQRRNT